MAPTPDPEEIQQQEEQAPFQCAECGAAVIVHDGNYFRQCSHVTAAILANMTAVVYGKAKVN